MRALREQLLARRDALQSLADGLAEAAETVELDQTRTGRLTRMDALQSQAMAQASVQRRRQELARIAAALERMDDGEFGHCLDCGTPISVARLGVDATATLCVPCAERRER